MLSCPSIFLIESISPFRLIEHQIHSIVNGIKGIPIGSPDWSCQQHSRNKKPAMRNEVETRGPY
jgi:hypothetical protein